MHIFGQQQQTQQLQVMRLYFRNNQVVNSSRIKTNTSISYRAIPCRTFTVTGTTLS
jgi:hypothetical protein